MDDQQLFHNRYLLLRRVGKGGFSEVWQARDTMTDMEVAIKILNKQDEQGILLCRNEYLSTYELSHPHIVIPFHFDVEASRPYLVMKYISGGTLSDRIGILDGQQVDAIIHQIGQALEYLHALPEPVVHGDIKPDNILIDTSGKAYITDFGISFKMKQLLTQTLQSHYRETSFNGITPMAYRPPEFFKYKDWAVRPLSPRSDIWSFGVTLYHTFFNQLPFNGEGGLGQLIMMKTGNHSLEESLDFPVDSAFISYYTMLRNCLHLDPEDRTRVVELIPQPQEMIPAVATFEGSGGINEEYSSISKIKKKQDKKLLSYLLIFGIITSGLIAYVLFSDRNDAVSGASTIADDLGMIEIDDDTLSRLGLADPGTSAIVAPEAINTPFSTYSPDPPSTASSGAINNKAQRQDHQVRSEISRTLAAADTTTQMAPNPVITLPPSTTKPNPPDTKPEADTHTELRTAIIRPNIRLPFVLQREITSADDYPPGTRIPFIVREDVKSYDKVFLSQGTTVYAVVNKSSAKKISFSFEPPRTTGGTPLKKLNLNSFNIEIGKTNRGTVFMPATSAYQKDVLIK